MRDWKWIAAALAVACSGPKEAPRPPEATKGAQTTQPATGVASAPASTAPATSTASAPAESPAVTLANAPAKAVSGRPLYYERAITRADLEGRSLYELSLMRNWIFARVGNSFAIYWLDEYFSAQPWYKPAEKLDTSKLGRLDFENAQAIYEAERKTPEQLDLLEAALFARHGHLRPADPEPLKAKLRAAEGFKENPAFDPKRLAKEEVIELILFYNQRGIDVSYDAGYSAEAYWEAEVWNEKEQKWEPFLATVAEGGPVNPEWYDSVRRQYSAKELRKKSQRELRLLRNAIYARHGRPFKSVYLQNYFGHTSWYQPDPAYTDARLSEVDRRNIKLIKSVEDEMGGPISDVEHMQQEGWFKDEEYGWMSGA